MNCCVDVSCKLFLRSYFGMNSLINAVFFSFPTVFDVSTLEVVALPVTNFIRFLEL